MALYLALMDFDDTLTGNHDVGDVLNWFISAAPAGRIPTAADDVNFVTNAGTGGVEANNFTCASPSSVQFSAVGTCHGTVTNLRIVNGVFNGPTLIGSGVTWRPGSSCDSVVTGAGGPDDCYFDGDPGNGIVSDDCEFTNDGVTFTSNITDTDSLFGAASNYNGVVNTTGGSVTGGTFAGGGTFTNVTVSQGATVSNSASLNFVNCEIHGGTWGAVVASGDININSAGGDGATFTALTFGTVTGITALNIGGMTFSAAWAAAVDVRSATSRGNVSGNSLGNGSLAAVSISPIGSALVRS